MKQRSHRHIYNYSFLFIMLTGYITNVQAYRLTFLSEKLAAFTQKYGATHLTGFIRRSLLRIKGEDPRTRISPVQHAYLTAAKSLYAGPYTTDLAQKIEDLKNAALHEYGKTNTPTYKELLITDYHNVSNKEALNSIPYCSSQVNKRAYFSPNFTTHKQKFLIHCELPLGWIEYQYSPYSNGSIEYVGVNPLHRQHGYGAYLMTYALYEMQIAGVTKAELVATEDATNFHRKLGFFEGSRYTMNKPLPQL